MSQHIQTSKNLLEYLQLHHMRDVVTTRALLQSTSKNAAPLTFLWQHSPEVFHNVLLPPNRTTTPTSTASSICSSSMSMRGEVLVKLLKGLQCPPPPPPPPPQQLSSSSHSTCSGMLPFPNHNIELMLTGNNTDPFFPQHPLPPPARHIPGAEKEATQLLHAIVRVVMFDTSLPVVEKNGEDVDDDGHHGEGVNALAEMRQLQREKHEAEVTQSLAKKKVPILQLLRSARLIKAVSWMSPVDSGNTGEALGASSCTPSGSSSPIHSLQFMMATPSVQRWWLLEALIRQEVSTAATTSPAAAASLRLVVAEVLCFLASATDHRTVYRFPPRSLQPLVYRFLIHLGTLGFIYPLQFKEDGDSKGFLVPRATLECLVPSASSHSRKPISNLPPTGGNGISGSSSLLDTCNARGVIIETNFRLYAYVDQDSPVLGILCYFAKLEVCLKNFYVFCITRHSYSRGLTIGLTTDLILRFLEANAHPAMTNIATVAAAAHSAKKDRLGKSASTPIVVEGGGVKKKTSSSSSPLPMTMVDDHNNIVPDSIVDQFRMWEKEQSRVTIAQETVLLTCPSPEAAAALHLAATTDPRDDDGGEGDSSTVPSTRGRRNRDDDDDCGGGGVRFYNGQQLVVSLKCYKSRIKPFLGL